MKQDPLVSSSIFFPSASPDSHPSVSSSFPFSFYLVLFAFLLSESNFANNFCLPSVPLVLFLVCHITAAFIQRTKVNPLVTRIKGGKIQGVLVKGRKGMKGERGRVRKREIKHMDDNWKLL